MLALLQRTGLLWLLCLLAGLAPAAATHLVGGELTYKYLDATGPADRPLRYQLSARIYFNKEAGSSAPDGTPTIVFSVFSKDTKLTRLVSNPALRASFEEITLPGVPGCGPVQAPRVTLAFYQVVINLPVVAEGYQAVYSTSARNDFITNISNSGREGMTLSVDMAPASLPNSSPDFSDKALLVTCLGDTSYVLNNAFDADGDRLSYRLATPAGISAAQPVRYEPGYSAAQPFGATGYATIDARTGLARYFSQTQGTFLLAVDVQEFRTVNGKEILLGTLRRDIQIVVRACSGAPNQVPAFSGSTLASQSFRVEEGQAVEFPIAATDPEGQAVSMAVGSVLLDGPGPIQSTFDGQAGSGSGTSPVGVVVATGIGRVGGTFRLAATCGLARAEPYDVVVTVTDAGCGSKTIAAVFRITVTRPAGPAALQGEAVLCAQTVATYTATGPGFGGYRWAVRGGRVQGSATGPTVQVVWERPGTGQLSVLGLLPTGCYTDSVSKTVEVQTGPKITGPAVYCKAAAAGLRYAIDGAPGAYQWSITSGSIVSGQGTNTVQIDIVPGATATLQVVAPALLACGSLLRISPDDTCPGFFNVITPNGDGRNDVFTIENVERLPNTQLTVYNRWGRQVFHSNNYRNTYGGPAAGVYYYLCRLSTGATYKGWFEVVR